MVLSGTTSEEVANGLRDDAEATAYTLSLKRPSLWYTNPMAALILVDVQHDFLPGGAMAVSDGDQIIPVIKDLLQKPKWDAIIVSKDWHPAGHISFASSHEGQEPLTGKRVDAEGQEQTLWPDHCIQGTKGAELPSALQEQLASPALAGLVHTVHKGDQLATDAYSAFQCSTLPASSSDSAGTRTSSTSSLLTQHLHALGIQKAVVTGLATDYCVKATALGALQDAFDTFIVDEACKAVSGSNFATWEELRGKGAKVVSVNEVQELL